MPIAVISCVTDVSLSPPLTVEVFHEMSTFRHARIDIRTMIAAAIGTVYFSNAWIQ